MSVSTILTILASLTLVIDEGQSSLLRRFNYDARLYEHFAYDSRYIQYSRTKPEEWKNLTELTDSRNFTFNSMICTYGPGAWILYPDPSYMMGNSQLYYLVVGEFCVRSDDIDSVQPLGKMDELLEKGVLLFEQPQFASAHTFISEGEGSGGGGSLIFSGGQTYVVSGGSTKLCLVPGMLTDDEDGYCLIPDLKTSFNLEGTLTVKEKCSEDASDEKVIVVNNCYARGVHEIYSDRDMTIDKLKEVCSGGGSDFLKAKFSIVTELWNKRLGAELINPPVDYRPEDQLKMNLIWGCLDIFKTSCPAVDPMYVYLLGHLYMMHMKKYWSAGNETFISLDSWIFAKDFVNFCVDLPDDIVPSFKKNCKSQNQLMREPTVDTPVGSSWYEITNGEAFDSVIEQMWLIFNFVVPTCSQASGYVTNDWSDIVVFFHQAFLDPLQEQWAEPGEWSKIYTAVFHGYDIREEHHNIVGCLAATLEASPEFDPIGRPKKFRDYMYYKYELPGAGQIEKPSTSLKPKQYKRNVEAVRAEGRDVVNKKEIIDDINLV